MTVFPIATGRRLWRHLMGALAAALLLAACGGSDQIDPFTPNRIVVFGDEASVLTSEGRKYTINALNDDSTLNCVTYPLWIQILAESFGPRFPQCNPDNLPAPNLIYAAEGAKAADVLAQVNTHLATGGLSNKDLVTVYAGSHDVRELYAQYPTVDANTLVSQAETRGAQLAEAVNTAARAGGRVLIVTLPNQALTPWGIAQTVIGTDRRDLLTRLSERFNSRMRVGLLNDSGRTIGLVDAADLLQYRVTNPSTLSLANVVAGACDLPAGTPLTDCTANTLKKNADGSALASASTWLWADDYQWGPVFQSQVGSSANSRAHNNPF